MVIARESGAVRTRGFIVRREAVEEIRTRSSVGGGPIRTRGPSTSLTKLSPWTDIDAEGLAVLLGELREAQDGFPLTLVVDDVSSGEVDSFLTVLHSRHLLGRDDAVWGIGPGEYGDLSEAAKEVIGEGAYLTPPAGGASGGTSAASDRVDFLSPDLAFVSVADKNDLSLHLDRWAGRAWALVAAAPHGFCYGSATLADKLEEPKWMRRWRA